MNKVELLYKTENVSRILSYYYDVHTWKWDAKFWLVDNKWCTDLAGKNTVGDLTDGQAESIRKFMPIIEQHEKENCNWIAFQNCRKRTCICKFCKKICNCSSCKGKINDCDKSNWKSDFKKFNKRC